VRSLFVLASVAAVLLAGSAVAETPVHFPDQNLEMAVEAELWIDDPTPSEMLWLTSLNAGARRISDLTGLEYAKNLYTLQLTHNLISDLSPLSELTGLRKLIPNNNQISDLSPLSGLVNLEYLDIHENRISDISALSGLTELQFLNIHDNQISDLSPLSGLSKLQFLDINGNQIIDLTPLAGLASLRHAALQGNRVVSIPDLSGLTNLEMLDVSSNQVRDISGLLRVPNLTSLFLRGNLLNRDAYCSHLRTISENRPGIQIYYDPNTGPPTGVRASDGERADVEIVWDEVCNGPGYTSYYRVSRAGSEGTVRTPISNWQTTLRFVDTDVPPGPVFSYWVQTAVSAQGFSMGDYSRADTGWRRAALTISSTPGGSATAPGEGVFLFAVGEVVSVTAEPLDPNLYFFLGWAGTAVDAGNVADANEASTTVMIDDDYVLCARFATRMNAVYVDDDAPGDPAPGDPIVSDPQKDGTPEHPFDAIQEAIDVAIDGISVIVRAGTYCENIDLKGKNIRLMGFDPNGPNDPYAVIDGAGRGPVVTFMHGEGPGCLLDGFALTGGRADLAAALYCHGSSPTIAHCLIVGNHAIAPNSAAVFCIDSNAVFTHCTIADNVSPASGAALYLLDSGVVLTNAILWANGAPPVLAAGDSDPSITYTDVKGGWPGLGNIDADPLFAQPGRWDPNGTPADPQDDIWFAGDYHLKSSAGRWDPAGRCWIGDNATSPCLNAGDPFSPVADESPPNGGRINMGAYGGTPQASKSPSDQ